MTNAAITPLQFTEWAHQASRGFISNGVPMGSAITKVASENELSPVQIQRVCEIANHHAYQELFKVAEDKSFEFPLAKVEDVMSSLNGETTKIAAEYILDPVSTEEPINVNDIFGVSSFGNEIEVEESVKKAGAALEKISAAKDELNSRLLYNAEEVEVFEKEFMKLSKQLVLNGLDISDIRSACISARPSNDMDDLMAKTAMYLAHDGVFGAKIQHMIKSAEAVELKEISSKLGKNSPGIPVRVINGSHPIISMVNTISDKYKDGANIKAGIAILDEKSKIIKTGIKDLNTSKKVDQFVQKEAF